MIEIIGSALIAHRIGRRIELERLELNYKVRALVQFQIDPEVARVFAFSGGERSKVISLAQRRGVIR